MSFSVLGADGTLKTTLPAIIQGIPGPPGIDGLDAEPALSPGTIWLPFAQGSVLFEGPSGIPAQDNANLFWDATNHKLGIGTTGPATPLQVVGVIQNDGLIRSTGGTATGAAGPGIEFQYNVGLDYGGFTCYDRTGAVYKPLQIDGATVTLAISGIAKVAVSAAGNVRFNGYGAGTLTTDASGNITAVSDERFKDIQGSFTSGLKELLQIRPILYKWNPNTNLDTKNVYAGFSAQNVLQYIPEAVGQNDQGYSLSDRPLLAAAFNAIQELSAEIDELRGALNLAPKDRAATLADEGRLIVSELIPLDTNRIVNGSK